jgi:hypothetical protein
MGFDPVSDRALFTFMGEGEQDHDNQSRDSASGDEILHGYYSIDFVVAI